MNKISPLPRNDQSWQMTLYIMFAAQLLSIIGFAFCFPFLPFYIRELGVTDERLVPFWAGILAASAGLVMVFFSPIWGWIAGPFLGGIMASSWGYRWPFAAVGAIVALSLPFLISVRPSSERSTSSQIGS